MLFLGTRKYPNPNEYQQFISDHGGSMNAYTSSQHTNYFFNIDAAELEGALDRFSQFFIAPLLDAHYVERERNAVHSEYQVKLLDDYRREQDVFRHVINPAHPRANFSVGNLDTLADRPNESIREALLAFYQAHYSADRMTLVVLGREPIVALKAMVADRFLSVPQRPVVESEMPPLYSHYQLPLEVEIQPAKTLRRMSLNFDLPSVQAYYAQKPLAYLGHLLGHEGKGSLLSVLKQQGWAESLVAGGRDLENGGAIFQVSVGLTKAGVANRATVRALIFHAIRTIEEKGLQPWRFDEKRLLAQTAFTYQPQLEAMAWVSALANNLHRYPVAHAINGPYYYQQLDMSLMKRLLSLMTPDNVLVSTVFPEAQTDRVSYYYQVPYRVSPLDGRLASLDADLIQQQFHLPHKNPFIPGLVRLFKKDNDWPTPQRD